MDNESDRTVNIIMDFKETSAAILDSFDLFLSEWTNLRQYTADIEGSVFRLKQSAVALRVKLTEAVRSVHGIEEPQASK